ncbi:MAG TPA: MarR family transcriptional regulator [Devosia sp.]|nr:MarR family transcriptional regulator [Devosia sp.]
MVKKLDEKSAPALIDHIGWRLTRLSRQWKAEFDAEMVRRGHGWMTEARGAVIGHLRPGGLSQSALTAAMGITKQAVQQLVDDLAAEGIVERVPDPSDGRGRIVRFTGTGISALEESNAVKLQIEAEWRAAIGSEPFDRLVAALDGLNARY